MRNFNPKVDMMFSNYTDFIYFGDNLSSFLKLTVPCISVNFIIMICTFIVLNLEIRIIKVAKIGSDNN